MIACTHTVSPSTRSSTKLLSELTGIRRDDVVLGTGSHVRVIGITSQLLTLVAYMFSLVFALGAATAALAGVLAAPIRGAEPFMGIEALGVAFVVVVVGGMGSFGGALVGGLLIGILQSVMSTLWPPGAHLMIYVAMVAVLLLLPHGLLGRRG